MENVTRPSSEGKAETHASTTYDADQHPQLRRFDEEYEATWHLQPEQQPWRPLPTAHQSDEATIAPSETKALLDKAVARAGAESTTSNHPMQQDETETSK
jgi:hypothetical protein